jgi:membrane-bound hydrogenase subunit mbhJ
VTTASPGRAVSVWVLPIDSGGCGACVQQMYALLGPRYADALRARGVAVALSPRHADVVLIAGALSRAAREPVARLLDSVPQPRALVAVGDCAINGCVFRGSPLLAASAAEDLDVNVEIGGCPPTPEAILDAIGEASRILASESAAEHAGDAENETDDDSDEEMPVADGAGALRADQLDGEDA